MKKTITILLFLLMNYMGSFAQFNPAKSLTWNHWYITPNNYYTLNWLAPDTSFVDTLVGYNIYRNSILWRFQPNIGLLCDSFNCPDPNFLLIGGFYMKVTAVYNYNHIESAATDSIYDMGVAIDVEETANEAFFLYNNLVQAGEKIKVPVSASKIFLYNAWGIVVKESFEGEIDTEGLARGMYYLRTIKNNYSSTSKVIIY